MKVNPIEYLNRIEFLFVVVNSKPLTLSYSILIVSNITKGVQFFPFVHILTLGSGMSICE